MLPVVYRDSLLIASGVDIHMEAYSHRRQKQFQKTSHALAFGWHAPGLKTMAFSPKNNLVISYF